MAATERPAAAERVAVLETRLLPGTESRIDWAFCLGSCVGTFEFARTAVRLPATGMRLRVGRAGLSRAAPTGVSGRNRGSERGGIYQLETYQGRSEPNEKPW